MKYIVPTLALVLLVPVLFFSQNGAEALPRAIGIIEGIVLPALFPASVLARLVAFSFIGEVISRALSKTFLWKNTRLHEKYLPAVVAGLFCGFPAGAFLLRDIKGENREKALALSSAPSLAFLCRVLGAKKGVLLFALFVVTLFSFAYFVPDKAEKSGEAPFEKMNFSKALVLGVEAAVSMSGAIIFFTVLLSFIPDGAPGILREVCASLCEIGTGALFSTNPVTLSLALSFGGLCVLSQISFMSDGVGLKYYLVSRLVLFLPTLFVILL